MRARHSPPAPTPPTPPARPAPSTSAGGQPAWNFSSADLVVRSLSQLSFVNMKQLIGNEELIEREQMEPELQPASLEDTVPYSLLD